MTTRSALSIKLLRSPRIYRPSNLPASQLSIAKATNSCHPVGSLRSSPHQMRYGSSASQQPPSKTATSTSSSSSSSSRVIESSTPSLPPLTPSQALLLPKHISDLPAIQHLTTLSSAQVTPLIPHLLSFLQDPNWPCFLDVFNLIMKHKDVAIPHVKGLLRPENEDQEWKVLLLAFVVGNLTKEEREGFFGEALRRLVREPTLEEREEGVSEQAEFVLGLEDEGEE